MKPELVVRIEECPLKEFTHMAYVRMNDWQCILYFLFGRPHGDMSARLMVTTMKLKQDYTRTTSAGKARGKVKNANIIFRETPGKVAQCVSSVRDEV